MSRLVVKPGVEFAVVAFSGYLILDTLKHISILMNRDLVITSGTDGVHSGPTDPHKLGEAYDVRSNDMTLTEKNKFITIFQQLLNEDDFYCFLESPGDANEHFHCQRAKGTIFGIDKFLSAL